MDSVESEKIEAGAGESEPLLEVLDIVLIAVLVVGATWWFLKNKKKKEEISSVKSYSIQ